MSAPIKPGDACPSLTLSMSDETSMRIPASNGRGIVLFFYPKANTPGCTTESKAFSALLGDFQEKGYDVVGISRDSIASHRKFIEKQDLRIPLASDEDGSVCEAFGVWVEKKMYGKTFMGIERSTFLVDPEGIVTDVWRKVRVKGHAEAVLERLNA